MKERNFVGRFLTANIKGEIFEGDVRKAIIVNIFSIVGILSLLYFLVGGVLNEKWTYSIIIAVFLLLTSGTLFFYQKSQNTKVASIIIVSLMLMLEILLFIKIGESTTGMFWFYLFPLLAFFILGNKKGLFFSIFLILVAIVLLYLDVENFTHYPAELHERFILTYIVTGLLAFIFEYIRNRTFVAFVSANQEKTEYLEETLQQKEEIQTQSEILAKKNLELLQLSLAASETDNSIIITNEKTEIEWVNKGFTKMLKLTLEEFKNLCPTLISCSQNKEKIQQCLDEKKSILYMSFFELKDDSKIWVQSNITPVLDEKNEISKLVIIESDITQQKLAEQEIREKNEELKQQRDEILSKNDIISQKNDAIEQSIQYALTIQTAVLPKIQEFKNDFDNFLLYKPKDIVAGDFYWLTKIESTYFFAIVDCTGHGVPGAFMSLLASRILDEIVLMQKIYSPAKILEELHKNIFDTLDQKNSKNSDGMDLILCKLDSAQKDNFDLIFCGAKRPLIYYNSENKKIASIKGVRKSIGGRTMSLNNSAFVDTKLNLPKDSIIFLTSDGFTDQHNSARKRIGTKRLMSILEENIDLPLVEFKIYLDDFLSTWKNDQIQTDDIALWAVKL